MSLNPPNFDNDILRYLSSDFYFVEPQKIISGKNIVVQLWPCNARDIDASLFNTHKAFLVELFCPTARPVKCSLHAIRDPFK